jgi:hypothetical protein
LSISCTSSSVNCKNKEKRNKREESKGILIGAYCGIRWEGHMARMGEERKVYKVLVGKPEERTPLGRPRRGWEDGIRIDLREIGWMSIEWIQLAQDRDWWRARVNTVMNRRVLAPRS